jgi:hypothetical protein
MGLPAPDELLVFLSNSLPGQRAALLQYNTDQVEIAKLPDHLQDAAFIKAASQLNNQPMFVRWMASSTQRVAVSDRRALAEGRCARVAVAVERFRLRQQRWPKTLAEVVDAGLLPEVPDDPCNGLKLRYRVLPDRVVIYSVGADLKDDGGHLDRTNRSGAGTDWGVYLWNVDRRRQRPPGPVPAGLPAFLPSGLP